MSDDPNLAKALSFLEEESKEVSLQPDASTRPSGLGAWVVSGGVVSVLVVFLNWQGVVSVPGLGGLRSGKPAAKEAISEVREPPVAPR